MVTSGTDGKSGKSGKAGQRDARRARLAAALRENLTRRKQQARQQAGAQQTPVSDVTSKQAEPSREPAAGTPDFRRNRGGE